MKSMYYKCQKIRLSDIYSEYADDYISHHKRPMSAEAIKAVNQTIACRTSKLGVITYACEDCGEVKHVYRSCKNRFCPRCGYRDTTQWADKMLDKLAPCPHHHIVFTLPAGMRPLSKRNKDKIHSLLLRSSAETMIDWSKHKHRLTPGIMTVLHTAGSDQKYHPHVHMICSAGGVDAKNKFKKYNSSYYLVRQEFIAKKFRYYFETGIFKLYRKGELDCDFKNEIQLKSFILELNDKAWVVSIQGALSNAESIVKYVGRYSKRACISEHNILSAENGEIRFRYKNYKDTDHKGKPAIAELTLSVEDFFGRLFEHVPSKGFRVVRYYGMYSNRRIGKGYQTEEQKRKQADKQKETWREMQKRITGVDPLICPCCKKEMVKVEEYYDNRTRWVRMKTKDKVPDHWPIAV